MTEIPVPSPMVLRGFSSYIKEDGTIDMAKRSQYLAERAEYDEAERQYLTAEWMDGLRRKIDSDILEQFSK